MKITRNQLNVGIDVGGGIAWTVGLPNEQAAKLFEAAPLLLEVCRLSAELRRGSQAEMSHADFIRMVSLSERYWRELDEALKVAGVMP